MVTFMLENAVLSFSIIDLTSNFFHASVSGDIESITKCFALIDLTSWIICFIKPSTVMSFLSKFFLYG